MPASDLIIVGVIGAGLFFFQDEIRALIKGREVQADVQAKIEDEGLIGAVGNAVGGNTKVITKQEAEEKGGVGGVLANNLKSSLTLTPLPDDFLFGRNGLFTNPQGFFNFSQKGDLEKQASSVGLTGAELQKQTDTKQPVVTKLGSRGKRGKSVF